MRKGCVAVFKGKVTVGLHIIKIRLSDISSEILILWHPNFGLMADHRKLGCLAKRLHCRVMLKVRVTVHVQNINEFSLDHIFSTAEPFVTKLGVVMHRHRPKCYVKRLVRYLRGHGHSEGSYNQI